MEWENILLGFSFFLFVQINVTLKLHARNFEQQSSEDFTLEQASNATIKWQRTGRQDFG